MAKKFGKFLLLTATIAGAAAAYLYLQKKDAASIVPEEDDADYDDFSEDLEEAPRSYVPLKKETATEGVTVPATESAEEAKEPEETVFEEAVVEEAAPQEETPAEPENVEEFFDEEDV